MKNSIFYALLFLISGYNLQAQVFYSLNPYAGDLQNENFTLSSSLGDLIAGTHSGSDVEILHLLFVGAESELAIPENVEDIVIYPNPVEGILRIKSGSDVIKKIRIFNVKGETMYHKPLEVPEIDLTGLPAGLYLLKLFNSSDQQIGSFKIIKQ